jgi:hypothetical protein
VVADLGKLFHVFLHKSAHVLKHGTGVTPLAGAMRKAAYVLKHGTSAPQVAADTATATVPPGAPRIPLQLSPSVTQSDVLLFCALFTPFSPDGFKKIRLGNKHDGGYIFIDDFAPISAVISCGISNDVTCDVALADLGKDILQYDHTVEGPPVNHPRFHFHKQAIDAFRTIPGSVPLWEATNAAGEPTKPDLLLKIDIDGGEWETFANFPTETMKRFRQIICEFHWCSRLIDQAYYSQCLRAITNIREQFFPTHLHANNFVPFANVMGVAVPEVFEVTFLNKEFYRPAQRQKRAPTDVDNPNNPDAPDLYLGSPFQIY